MKISRERFMRHIAPWLAMDGMDGIKVWVTEHEDNVFLHAVVGSVMVAIGNGSLARCARAPKPADAMDAAVKTIAVTVYLDGHTLVYGERPDYPDDETVADWHDFKQATASGSMPDVPDGLPDELREALEGLAAKLGDRGKVTVAAIPVSDAGPTGMYV